MKNCELCKVPARMFCESDQASLCWDCDSKVHGANFLVERHTRTLLCHACQSLTPWKASGARLGNTLSLCERCAGGTKLDDVQEQDESEGDNDDDIETDDEDEEEEEEEEEDEVEDEDGDNQVVPWSATAQPPAPSSTSSEESVSRCNNNNCDEVTSQSLATVSLKRRREDHDFQGSNSNNCWEYKRRYGANWEKEVGLLRCDGEPSTTVSMRRFSDGETRQQSPYGCCNGRASGDV